MANRALNGDETKGKLFISYSRNDVAFADRLALALKDRGFEPLIDRSDIYAFEDWWERIEGMISEADTVVFILSPDAVSSDICQKEVALAASLNKRLAPIAFRKPQMADIPEPLQRLNFISFDQDTYFEQGTSKL